MDHTTVLQLAQVCVGRTKNIAVFCICFNTYCIYIQTGNIHAVTYLLNKYMKGINRSYHAGQFLPVHANGTNFQWTSDGKILIVMIYKLLHILCMSADIMSLCENILFANTYRTVRSTLIPYS